MELNTKLQYREHDTLATKLPSHSSLEIVYNKLSLYKYL